jgi:hypothetical protein
MIAAIIVLALVLTILGWFTNKEKQVNLGESFDDPFN